ncbi:D123-domain-containing protein [Jimgerdemannia flammicorona]|uniref:D123-domain-containing protein n=1 Tax=Jimgerdemannia flammicorona TaxID=994334 RepID=A0A433D8D3_9FUNG|nr:D123-domain-containing protein [Jimgerdemannia flammicorona]
MPASIPQATPSTDHAPATLAQPAEPTTFPPLTRQDVLNCSLSSWYETFRQVTFKSKVMRLSQEFVDYLNADSIFLPDDGHLARATVNELDDDDDDEEPTNFDEGDDDGAPDNTPHFPEVEEQIWQALNEFDGAIFPKLNWSSPRHMRVGQYDLSLHPSTSPTSLRMPSSSQQRRASAARRPSMSSCSLRAPISSTTTWTMRLTTAPTPTDRIRWVLGTTSYCASGTTCSHPWSSGLCQRDINYYEFLADMREEIEDKIDEFFEDKVRDKFPNRNYVFDVYLSRDRRKVYLVDFNPFGPMTDSLLFHWDDILSVNATDRPSLLLIGSQMESNMRSRSGPAFSFNMMAKDLVELGSGRTLAEFAEQFQRAITIAGQESSDEEGEGNSRGA